MEKTQIFSMRRINEENEEKYMQYPTKAKERKHYEQPEFQKQ